MQTFERVPFSFCCYCPFVYCPFDHLTFLWNLQMENNHPDSRHKMMRLFETITVTIIAIERITLSLFLSFHICHRGLIIIIIFIISDRGNASANATNMVIPRRRPKKVKETQKR